MSRTRNTPMKLPRAGFHRQFPPSPMCSKSPLIDSDTSLTVSNETPLAQLTSLLKNHLNKSPTPSELLRFVKTQLRHHPKLRHLDFHLFRFAATLDSFRHDHSTFEYMARSLVSSNRLDSLVWLLEFLASNPCPCSDGKLEKGIEFYRKMMKEKVKPDLVTFNILISGYCRNSKFTLALEVFQEMKDKGCVPNVVSFNSLIKGFFLDGKVEEAIGMAHEMIEFGCELSTVTCEILVDGLCERSNTTEASELILSFARKGVLPRGFDYFKLIEILCRNGKLGRAFRLIDELWSRGYAPSVVACTILIDALCGARKIDNSIKFIRKMLEEDIVPDTVTFNCFLCVMCETGQAVEANKLRVLASCKGLSQDSMTCRILISGYSKEGKREPGEALVNEMLDRGFVPDIATYNMLMDGLAKSVP